MFIYDILFYDDLSEKEVHAYGIVEASSTVEAVSKLASWFGDENIINIERLEAADFSIISVYDEKGKKLIEDL